MKLYNFPKLNPLLRKPLKLLPNKAPFKLLGISVSHETKINKLIN